MCTGLQTLRSERELVEAEISLYEQEKEAIKQVLLDRAFEVPR